MITVACFKATRTIDVQWFKPLAFGYLQAWLERELPVRFLTPATADELDPSVAVVGISSTSQDIDVARELAAAVRVVAPRALIVLGGHHVSHLPRLLPAEFDAGVVGEGEETFAELIMCHASGGELSTVKGVCFHGPDGQVTVNPPRPLITPLDRLPHPVRSAGERHYVFTSRGCPYRCRFCSSAAFWDKTRFFSAEYVVEEFASLAAEFPELEHFQVWDDLFVADRPRFARIVELMEQRGLAGRGISFSVRANLVDDELCRLMKRVRTIGVGFGAESGSDRILGLMGKGTTAAVNQRALDTLHRHGVPVINSFVIGWPGETEAELVETFVFVLANIAQKRLTPNVAINILMPIPGTEVWEQACSAGLINGAAPDWGRLSVFASFKDSTAHSFDDWVASRRAARSLYLNEEQVSEDRLYALMKAAFCLTELVWAAVHAEGYADRHYHPDAGAVSAMIPGLLAELARRGRHELAVTVAVAVASHWPAVAPLASASLCRAGLADSAGAVAARALLAGVDCPDVPRVELYRALRPPLSELLANYYNYVASPLTGRPEPVVLSLELDDGRFSLPRAAVEKALVSHRRILGLELYGDHPVAAALAAAVPPYHDLPADGARACWRPFGSLHLRADGASMPCRYGDDSLVMEGGFHGTRFERLRQQHRDGELPDCCRTCGSRRSAPFFDWQALLGFTPFDPAHYFAIATDGDAVQLLAAAKASIGELGEGVSLLPMLGPVRDSLVAATGEYVGAVRPLLGDPALAGELQLRTAAFAAQLSGAKAEVARLLAELAQAGGQQAGGVRPGAS